MRPNALPTLLVVLVVISIMPGTLVLILAFSRWRREGKPGWRRLVVLYLRYAWLTARNFAIAAIPFFAYYLILEPYGWMRLSKRSLELSCKLTFWVLMWRAEKNFPPIEEPPASLEMIEDPNCARSTVDPNYARSTNWRRALGL